MATEQELQQREQQLNQVEQQAKQVASQKVPRRSFGSRIGAKEQQAIINNKQKALEVLGQIQQQRQQIQQIRQQQSQPQGRSEADQYNYGRKLALSGKSAYGLTKTEQQGYRDAKEGLNQVEKIKQSQEATQQNNIKLIGESPKQLYQGPVQQGSSEIQFRLTGKEVPQYRGPVRLGESEIVFRELNQRVPVSEEKNYGFYRIEPILPMVSTTPPQNKEQSGIIDSIISGYDKSNKFLRTKVTEPTAKYINQKTGLTIEKFSNLASAGASSLVGFRGYGFGSKQSQEFLAGITEGIITDIKENPAKQVVLFGAGVGLGYFTKVAGIVFEAIGSATNLKLISTIPKYTSVVLGTGLVSYSLYSTGSKIISADNEKDIGKIIGVETKNLALIGAGSIVGTKSFEKTYDFVRTIGLKEIPATEVVAPEYFAGQRYPQIKRGQSVGELKQEFNQPIESIGETKGVSRVFTASPQSFSKEIITGKGSSELYGLYSAPRLSATFLKLQGEKNYNLFSFDNVFSFGKPTALRTTLPVELIPELSPYQTSLTKYNKDLLELFGGGNIKKGNELIPVDLGEPLLPKGKAYIPFMKTEKEAIIPYDTLLNVVERKAFFKLNGRRIVILESEVAGEAVSNNLKTIQELSSSYSYRSPSYSALNPLNIQLSYSQSKSYSSEVSSSFIKLSSSASASASKSIPKLSSINYPSVSPPKSPPSYPSYSPPKSPTYNPPTSTPRYPTYSPPKYPPPKTPNKPPRKSIKGIGEKLVEGFKTYYYSKGNKIYLGGISGKAEAIFKGEKKVLNDLSARFGIEETNKLVKGNNVNASPRYNKYFREFKIKGGKAIKTPNVFIQKRGKRLSTSTERSLIQKARKKR